MTLRVAPFDGTAAEWDAFVVGHPGFTLFHRFAWKPLLERVHGHECPYLSIRDASGKLTGVLPIVRVRSFLFGHFLVSMPFVSYGGPLGGENEIRALVDGACKLADESGAGLLELRNRGPLPISLPASHRKVTVVLDLPVGDREALWRQIGTLVRNRIKRAQKEGMTVRFGADQLDQFFEVFAEHMRDLGTPVQPKAFFRAIAEAFGEDVWFACVYHSDKPIASGAGFRWGGEFEVTWSSSLAAYNPLSPNMLLYWSFMERAANEGLTLFNFGRCTPGGGTHRFKLKWNSREEQLWWYQRSSAGLAKTPSPDDEGYSWGPRLWKRIPVPLATALGPRIVRYIP
jgi:FemAB-related protein (PEP-CTERM system-associated)